ncbi:hypothetical protein SGM_0290 [Streptomyces griseoaurantiacus M045]|uniref:Uncharacterized protein n=1 Tax=Streptomyces griseoaurantiacus M045 TaxID=996637 RepID=F3NAA6_9ACTN|nr:hypothetical protein SGM_0290 [Streptomyces griseoaurantiacus M045]
MLRNPDAGAVTRAAARRDQRLRTSNICPLVRACPGSSTDA